jgi:hypothetical protein
VDADSICDDTQSADESASEYSEDDDSDSSSSVGDYDPKKTKSSYKKNKRRQVPSTNSSKKKMPAQVSSTMSSTRKRKRTSASTTTTTSNGSTNIETLVKVNKKYTTESIMKVIAKYDKMFLEDDSWGIYVRVASKFHGITPNQVLQWVRDRHQYKSTERADGSVSFESKTGKHFSEDECERLRNLFNLHPNRWDIISRELERKPKACRKKYEQLMKKDQLMSVEQFRNLPDGFLKRLNHKIVVGDIEFGTLIHVSFIGPGNLSKVTSDAAERTIGRFKTKIKRDASPATIEYVKSLVGKIALMPDEEVREVIDYDLCKECHLPHIRHPESPHDLREKVHKHVYASNCIIQAINKHRNSPDRGRSKWYGQGKDYSEHLYFYFISAEANRDLSFYPVGMTDDCTNDGFFKTLLPVEVTHVYKLIFVGDDIKDAKFEEITL